MDRDNAKARRESGFEDDEEDEEEEDFGFLDEELVSKKRLFLRRLGSQFRVNARSEMDIKEDATFLWCKTRRLEKVIQHTEDDVTCFPRRSMETNATIIALGGQ